MVLAQCSFAATPRHNYNNTYVIHSS